MHDKNSFMAKAKSQQSQIVQKNTPIDASKKSWWEIPSNHIWIISILGFISCSLAFEVSTLDSPTFFVPYITCLCKLV